MKNNLSDLKNYLFAQIERLDDESMSKEEFDKEVKRSMALATLSKQVIGITQAELKCIELANEYGYCTQKAVKEFLEVDDG